MDKSDPKFQAQRLLELEGGLAIWHIGIDLLREQDKNARVMSDYKFRLLQDTIKRDKRLESLPFVTKQAGDRNEFDIISGHHRTRASRMAGMKQIYCLVDETNLKKDYIKSKQLSHNAIQGDDDDQILLEIYQNIEDIQARIDSGIEEENLLKQVNAVNMEELGVEFESQIISLVFTKKGFKDFEDVLIQVANSEKIYLNDYKYFDTLVKTARDVSGREDIRNTTGIISKMCEIVREYYKLVDAAEKAKNKEAKK